MELPERLLALIRAASRVGRVLLVGGCVRDHILGRSPKDFDIEVFGADPDALQRELERLARVDHVGRSFGVLKVRDGDREYDFALARRESRTGSGHRGFRVEVDAALTETEAAGRRDFTINAIGWDPVAERLVDPLGGLDDLRRRVLRHCGPRFGDDPLRVLRGFQFASRFDLEPAPETIEECRKMVAEFPTLARERVWMEWEKWAALSVRPSRGLRFLRETGWLAHFPVLQALVGVPQEPEWHPEGDVWEHTVLSCDACVGLEAWRGTARGRRRDLLLAVLLHDVGKPGCTRQEERRGRPRWVSPGHDMAGVPLARAFLEALAAPGCVMPFVAPLVEAHMLHLNWEGLPPPNVIRRLARRLEPATVADLAVVMRADHLGRGPQPPGASFERIAEMERAAAELALEAQAPRPILMGRHLIALGLKPGPAFKPILEAAFEAQLDGAFSDEEGALGWARAHVEVGR